MYKYTLGHTWKIQWLSMLTMGLRDFFMENCQFRIKNTVSDPYLYMFAIIQGGTDVLVAIGAQ